MGILRNPKTIARGQMATGLGIIVFWTLFFTVGLAPANAPACYFAFEHSFPLPDLILAAGLLTAGALTNVGRPLGPPLGLVCAGGLLFLGLLDASFNTQNGIYTSSLAEGLTSAAINLWCIALGIATAATMALPHAPSRA
jgi:hypothetical protein